MNEFDFKDSLDIKIMRLSQNIWENRVKRGNLSRWLENFESSDESEFCERTHALYLLSNFMYFGSKEIRQLLKSLYRDKFLKPLVQDVRKKNNNIKNYGQIRDVIEKEIRATRFIGIGNPSESGTHLLYFFRQENELSKDFFIHSHEILSYKRDSQGSITVDFHDPTIKRYILLDDVCGSGTQAIEYSEKLVSEIKNLDKSIEVNYFTLFSLAEGMSNIRANSQFNLVDCIFELDDTFKCFSENSRQFGNISGIPISKDFTEHLCRKYGSNLVGDEHCLGYKNSQLLLGFTHNTPDNTLPIFWGDYNWTPLFKRYNKI